MHKLIVGNWKMNGVAESLQQVGKVVDASDNQSDNVQVVICPPYTLIDRARELTQNSKISIGGQDCHSNVSGPHTGDVSAEMLADLGATFVIVGHSERRDAYGETNALIVAKARAALKSGLTPIICVGENLETRESGETLEFIAEQIRESIPEESEITSIVIAYEPVWAIGTGKSADATQINEVHTFINAEIKKRFAFEGEVRILYGGSVSPTNAKDIFTIPNVHGGLIGGASLKADSFLSICQAVR